MNNGDCLLDEAIHPAGGRYFCISKRFNLRTFAKAIRGSTWVYPTETVASPGGRGKFQGGSLGSEIIGILSATLTDEVK